MLMLRKVDGPHMCHLQELLIVTIPSAADNAMIHMTVQLNHLKFWVHPCLDYTLMDYTLMDYL